MFLKIYIWIYICKLNLQCGYPPYSYAGGWIESDIFGWTLNITFTFQLKTIDYSLEMEKHNNIHKKYSTYHLGGETK